MTVGFKVLMWCFLICCIKWFFKTYSVFLFNFFSRRFIYLSSPSFKLVLTIFHNKLLKEKLWSRMEWSHKTKKPMKQNSISAAFKKPTLSPVILRKNTEQGLRRVCLQCFLAVAVLRCEWWSCPTHPVCPHAGSGSLLIFILSEGSGWKILRS